MVFKDDYFFMSTFHVFPFQLEVGGKLCDFITVEAAYQAQKNPEIANHFSTVRGLEAKRFAEQLKITVPDWESKRIYAMANALNAKFSNKILLAKLKGIKEQEIIHDNYWGDTFWGVYKGEGKNILGKLLTVIRDTNNDLASLYKYIKENLSRL